CPGARHVRPPRAVPHRAPRRRRRPPPVSGAVRQPRRRSRPVPPRRSLQAYMSMLEDLDLRERAAQEFVRYELSIRKGHVASDGIADRLADPSAFTPFAACEIVYMLAEGYLQESLIAPENLKKLDGMRIHVVHGRCDHVCIPKAAWRVV